jgi:hypothetical protein
MLVLFKYTLVYTDENMNPAVTDAQDSSCKGFPVAKGSRLQRVPVAQVSGD